MTAQVGATSRPRIAVVAQAPSTLQPKLRVVVSACGGARAIATKGKIKANIVHLATWLTYAVDVLFVKRAHHQHLHHPCQVQS